MMRTGLVTDPLFFQHKANDTSHPENWQRLEAIYQELASAGLMETCTSVPLRVATRAEICRVHADSLFDRVAKSDGQHLTHFDPDTSGSAQSYQAALAAAGSGIALSEAVMKGELDNGFLLARPPGHHATHDRIMGFCLFNNIAIAAQHLIAEGLAKRVAIVDFDVHHGNGTQNIFYDRADVLYLSSHQFPHYPGTGRVNELGEGNGVGASINLPLRHGVGDTEMLTLYEAIFKPILTAFKPDIILASAGYDGLAVDPLAGLQQTPDGMGDLSGWLVNLANDACKGRLVFFLEGGYHLTGLALSVAHSVKALCGQTAFNGFSPIKQEAMRSGLNVDDLKSYFGSYWPTLEK